METMCHSFVKRISVAPTSVDIFSPPKIQKAFKIVCNPSKRGGFWNGGESVTLFTLVKYREWEMIIKYFSSPSDVWDAIGREVGFGCCHPETAEHGCIAAPRSREPREAGRCSPFATWWSLVAPDASFLCKKSLTLWLDLHCSLSVQPSVG